MYPYDPRYIYGRATMTEYIDAEGNAVIPEGVTDIDEKAFLRCEELKTVTIPASVRCISGSAFLYCPNLTAICVAEDNDFLGSVDGVLYHKQMGLLLLRCPRGKSGALTIPEGTYHIDAFTVWGCFRLTEVHLPESLRWIDEGAFRGCTGLTSLTIPAGVKRIGVRAFSGCANLGRVVIRGEETEIAATSFDDSPRVTVYAPADSRARRCLEEHGIPCGVPEPPDKED